MTSPFTWANILFANDVLPEPLIPAIVVMESVFNIIVNTNTNYGKKEMGKDWCPEIRKTKGMVGKSKTAQVWKYQDKEQETY